MPLKLLNRVGMFITTTGTGTVTADTLISNRFLTPAEAGAANGDESYWLLEEGSDFEIFRGTFSTTGPTVSRDTVIVSKISGVKGTSKMNLAGNATLRSVSPDLAFIDPSIYALLNSPAFTGTPTAPTASAGTNTTQVATTAFVITEIAARIASLDVMTYKGVIDCSANPNYPAANAGDTYRVSVAGKIGGASGPNVEAFDILICGTDSSASGNHATVGANWAIIQANIDGALTTAGGALVGALDFAPAVTVASGATTDLGAQNSNRVAISGTTTITSFGTGANKYRQIRFTGALTLTHNATSLILPGGSNITTAAGDAAICVSDGSGNWRVLIYQRASGKPIVPSSISEVTAGSGQELPTIALNWATASTIASAATVNIGAATTNYVVISGTTTITAFDNVAASVYRVVRFSGALTLTHNGTSLILPGSANITTAAGDMAMFVSEGSGNWRCIAYQRANGQPLSVVYANLASAAIATAAEYRSATASKLLAADNVWTAAGLVSLTDAATISVDLSTGINFTVTLGGNRTLGAPTNTKAGQSGTIIVVQDGTGGRTLAFNAVYKFAGGTAFSIDTTASRMSLISYFVRDSSNIILSGLAGVR